MFNLEPIYRKKGKESRREEDMSVIDIFKNLTKALPTYTIINCSNETNKKINYITETLKWIFVCDDPAFRMRFEEIPKGRKIRTNTIKKTGRVITSLNQMVFEYFKAIGEYKSSSYGKDARNQNM